jgi:hypothetical protein
MNTFLYHLAIQSLPAVDPGADTAEFQFMQFFILLANPICSWRRGTSNAFIVQQDDCQQENSPLTAKSSRSLSICDQRCAACRFEYPTGMNEPVDSMRYYYSPTTSNEASLLAQTGRMKILKTDLLSHIRFEIRDEVVAE